MGRHSKFEVLTLHVATLTPTTNGQDHKRKDGQRSYGGEPEKLETQTVKEKARQKVTAVSSYYWEDKGKTVKVVVELESNGLELSSVQAKDVAVVHNEDANTITLDLSTTDGAKALRLGPLKLAKDIKADEAPRVKVTDKRVILRVTKVNADEKWYDLVKK